MTESAEQPRRRWWIPVVVTIGLLAVASVIAFSVMNQQSEPVAVPTPTPTATVEPTPTATPSPTPTVVGAPANTTAYDLATLPVIDVFAVTASMPVDDAPDAATLGESALPVGAGAPVFADPLGQPIAMLPSTLRYGGTTVPVVVHDTHWVKVLLAGRQGTPPGGNPAQTTGWMRVADVTLTPAPTVVEVSLGARTIDVVTGGQRERIADDFGWGAPATPTPVGRTFIMHTEIVPEFGYTRGHPMVYLGVQSPTLSGFAGASVAVTAFHYHDNRSGEISNGCLRLGPEAIDRLAQLPAGTAVFIRN